MYYIYVYHISHILLSNNLKYTDFVHSDTNSKEYLEKS